MKSILKHFIGLAMFTFLLQINYLNAQNDVLQYAICQNCNGSNPTMGPNINYTIDQISSDYGMRVAGGGTRFHRGIDNRPNGEFLKKCISGAIVKKLISRQG